MKFLIFIILTALLSACGTTGKLEPAEGATYVLASQGCTSLVASWITGKVCYWKTTSSSETMELEVDVTNEDDWTMFGSTTEAETDE